MTKMPEQDSHILQTFEDKLHHIIAQQEMLLQENSTLRKNLQTALLRCETLQASLEQLRAEHEHLKKANVLAASYSDAKEAGKKLTALIKEVDKCIAMLEE